MPADDRQFAVLDRLMRETPTPHNEAVAVRAAIERINRETRARNRDAVRSAT